MALGRLKERMEVRGPGKDSNGDMGEATHAHSRCWLGRFYQLPALPPCFSLFTARFSSEMSLDEGQCFKAQKLFGVRLIVQIPSVR